jgi:uncharacterized protein (DUF2336 family)
MSARLKNHATKAVTNEDIRILVHSPDPEHRALAAQRVCRRVRDVALSERERIIAKDVLKIISEDAASLVRRALAVTLKNSPELPRELAVKLAEDIDSIAVPVLNFSPVLTDEDLVEVLKSRAAAKILAVARRPSVSGSVVENIVRYGDGKAVAELAANDGAEITADVAGRVLEAYRDDDLIAQAFIRRRDLPVSIIEKLITQVSQEAAIVLTRRHGLPVDLAVELASRTRERATIDIVDQSIKSREVGLLVSRLYEDGRLTDSLIMRAAGCGAMRFTEHALAIKAGISHAKAALMLHDTGPFSVAALCSHAGLSEANTRVMRAASVIYRDLELSGIVYDRNYFRELMIMRLLTLPLKLSDADQLYFLEKLDGFIPLEEDLAGNESASEL